MTIPSGLIRGSDRQAGAVRERPVEPPLYPATRRQRPDTIEVRLRGDRPARPVDVLPVRQVDPHIPKCRVAPHEALESGPPHVLGMAAVQISPKGTSF